MNNPERESRGYRKKLIKGAGRILAIAALAVGASSGSVDQQSNLATSAHAPSASDSPGNSGSGTELKTEYRTIEIHRSMRDELITDTQTLKIGFDSTKVKITHSHDTPIGRFMSMSNDYEVVDGEDQGIDNYKADVQVLAKPLSDIVYKTAAGRSPLFPIKITVKNPTSQDPAIMDFSSDAVIELTVLGEKDLPHNVLVAAALKSAWTIYFEKQLFREEAEAPQELTEIMHGFSVPVEGDSLTKLFKVESYLEDFGALTGSDTPRINFDKARDLVSSAGLIVGQFPNSLMDSMNGLNKSDRETVAKLMRYVVNHSPAQMYTTDIIKFVGRKEV